MKQDKKKKLRNKADRLYQEAGRIMYADKGCLICGGEYSCMHHYFPKSTSSALRYNIKNGIPICHKCHCRIHQSDDPTINNLIVKIKGQEWLTELELIKKTTSVKTSLEYYETICRNLELLMPYKVIHL
jgi:hypothetical protein